MPHFPNKQDFLIRKTVIIKCFKNLLIARIPFFKSLFKLNMLESSTGKINFSINFCGKADRTPPPPKTIFSSDQEQ